MRIIESFEKTNEKFENSFANMKYDKTTNIENKIIDLSRVSVFNSGSIGKYSNKCLFISMADGLGYIGNEKLSFVETCIFVFKNYGLEIKINEMYCNDNNIRKKQLRKLCEMLNIRLIIYSFSVIGPFRVIFSSMPIVVGNGNRSIYILQHGSYHFELLKWELVKNSEPFRYPIYKNACEQYETSNKSRSVTELYYDLLMNQIADKN